MRKPGNRISRIRSQASGRFRKKGCAPIRHLICAEQGGEMAFGLHRIYPWTASVPYHAAGELGLILIPITGGLLSILLAGERPRKTWAWTTEGVHASCCSACSIPV